MISQPHHGLIKQGPFCDAYSDVKVTKRAFVRGLHNASHFLAIDDQDNDSEIRSCAAITTGMTETQVARLVAWCRAQMPSFVRIMHVHHTNYMANILEASIILEGSVDTWTNKQVREHLTRVYDYLYWMERLNDYVDEILVEEPLYKYRGSSGYDASHAVAGQDLMGGSGILEWCFSMEDADQILANMSEHPQRFTNLAIIACSP